MLMKRVNLNLTKENNYHYLPVMVGDNLAEVLEITIVEGNKVVDLSSYNVLLKSNSYVTTNLDVTTNNRIAIAITSNLINLNEDMWIELYNDNTSVTTFPFRLNIVGRDMNGN